MDKERVIRYFSYITRYPHLFENADEETGVQIILDQDVFIEQQEQLWEKAKKNGEPEFWYDLGVVAEDKWVVVLRDLVRFPNGTLGGYIRTLNRVSQVERRGTDVVILPLYCDKILLLRHFRHDDRHWHWEAPRGFGESEISPEDNACKELVEETGLSIDRIVRLDKPEDASTNIAYFYAETSGTIKYEINEGIDTYRLYSIDELEKSIVMCDIDDFFTCRAMLLSKTANYI